jgi:hypothetical protein
MGLWFRSLEKGPPKTMKKIGIFVLLLAIIAWIINHVRNEETFAVDEDE